VGKGEENVVENTAARKVVRDGITGGVVEK
jgi:hypothetical protein